MTDQVVCPDCLRLMKHVGGKTHQCSHCVKTWTLHDTWTRPDSPHPEHPDEAAPGEEKP